MTAKAFAESLRISKAMGCQISRYLLKPSRAVLERLSHVYHVNLHRFLTGKGPSGLESDTAAIELLEQQAAAGHGVDVQDCTGRRYFQVLRSFISPYKPDRLSAVHVAGDSMAEEHINDGDIAVFHPGITEGNGIYIVSIVNSLVAKRVDFTPQTITLISANPAVSPDRS
ncbi:MAG: S24 family peptidase [Treponema sp.]|nr:S24 family peptidase [Treponema sp.]